MSPCLGGVGPCGRPSELQEKRGLWLPWGSRGLSEYNLRAMYLAIYQVHSLRLFCFSQLSHKSELNRDCHTHFIAEED